MSLILERAEREAAGQRLHELATSLQPLPRSLSGDGVRATLDALGRFIAPSGAVMQRHQVASGVRVLDWTVPREWNLREAWIRGPHGEAIVDSRRNLLHVVGYSAPVRRRLSLAELRPHLHSLPEQPDAIPYRTSYYHETWGFCLPHHVLTSLPEGEYEVCVDATLEPGVLDWGEIGLAGERREEILFSTHVCHPMMANDNLSGLVVLAELARRLAALPSRRRGYRFLVIPGTIGSIAWLAREDRPGGAIERVRGGLVLANLGDPGPFHYKRSRRGVAEIDRAAGVALRDEGGANRIEDFVPFGYDERQYNSPGFDLPIGSLTRTPWGRYPQYHTSLDDLRFVRPEALAGSLAVYLRVVDILEHNATYRNLFPKGEPQLGPRGLFGALGGATARERELSLLWVLSLSDGDAAHDLLHIAERSGISFPVIRRAASDLLAAGLLAVA